MKPPRPVSWIRWRYAAPRLVLLLLVYLGCRYGLDGTLKWAIVRSGEAGLGARVEVGDLTTDILGGRLQMTGLAAANPSDPMRNLLQAERLDLQIDVAALLHKRLVVSDGEVRGIQFDSPRDASGALETAAAEDEVAESRSLLAPLADAAVERGSAWMGGVSDRVEQDLVSQLQAPPLAKELEQKWPATFSDLENQVDALKEKTRQLNEQFREVKSNPLRNIGGLQQLQADLAATSDQVMSITSRINTLPQQIEKDRQAIQVARKHDEAFLRQRLQIDTIDGDQLSYYLLGEEADGYLGTAIGWLRYARCLVPSNKVAAESAARRGRNIDFSRKPLPEWLVERVRLDGSAHLGGQPMQLCGMLTDVASRPELHPLPAQLRLTAEGSVALEALVELDRRGAQPLDSLKLHCPQLALPQRTLGRPEKIALTLPASVGTLAANIQIAGELLNGTITFNQPQIRLQPDVGAIRDPQLVAAVTASLAQVDGFEADIVLSGTIDDPSWKLKSNLGPQVASGMTGALRTYADQRRQRLMAKIQAEIDQRLALIDQQSKAVQERLLAKLGENQKLLAVLAPLTGQGMPGLGGVSFPVIGRAPTDSLLK